MDKMKREPYTKIQIFIDDEKLPEPYSIMEVSSPTVHVTDGIIIMQCERNIVSEPIKEEHDTYDVIHLPITDKDIRMFNKIMKLHQI